MFAHVGVLRKPQREKFLRLTVHQNPRCFFVHLNQIGSESVSAINVLYQPAEFIVRNRSLILLQHVPSRIRAENAEIIPSATGGGKNREKDDKK